MYSKWKQNHKRFNKFITVHFVLYSICTVLYKCTITYNTLIYTNKSPKLKLAVYFIQWWRYSPLDLCRKLMGECTVSTSTGWLLELQWSCSQCSAYCCTYSSVPYICICLACMNRFFRCPSLRLLPYKRRPRQKI